MTMDRVAVDWVAVDWGVTYLRAWVMREDGRLCLRSDRGADGLVPDEFEQALLELVGGHLSGPTPVIACGAVGTHDGWAEIPYAPVPCMAPGFAQATRVTTQDERLQLYILPGVSQNSPADIMRGEETKIAGFLAKNKDFDGVLCLPGAHTKWVQISAEEIVSFQTVMTGELFELLSAQSVLRHAVGEGWDANAFGAAVSDGMSRPQAIAAKLFSLRASSLLHGLAPDVARAQLFGLLIGLELAATKPYWLGQEIALIGAPALCEIYAAALAAQGLTPTLRDGDDMTLAGLTAAYSAMADGK